ncbi:MAG: thiamine pyrophosphate-binding protein, partial [Thermoplasmatota archaeon]
VGWGGRHARNLLIEIAEKLHAPIATTSRAKGVVNEAHDLSLGVLGSIGSKHASQAVKNSDLIIIVGSGFRQANLVPAELPLIQLDIDPTRIGKTFDIAVGLVGDAQQTLQELAPLLDEKPPNDEFLSMIHKIRQKHRVELQADATNTSVPIYPGYVIQALKRNVSDDAIICVDVGDHTYWFYKKFICEGQRTYMSANMASMAFGLPASLSASIDFPDRQVVCITGDGGFAMLMADFTTAVRENLAVTIVVFNDGKLKNIKKEQERDGFPEYGVSYPNPDFASFARTAGGEGYRVEEPEKLDEALQKALTSEKPAIIDIVVDSEAMVAATKHVE